MDHFSGPIAESSNLCTHRRYGDFELRVSVLVKGYSFTGPGEKTYENAGVFFRSERLPSSPEVAGYQADVGFISGDFVARLSGEKNVDQTADYPLWGSLLDEFRPQPYQYPNPAAPVWLLAVADRQAVDGVLLDGEWNELTVVADGPRIELRLNGLQTVAFVEEKDVARSGLICLQLHSGGPSEVRYKDIAIRELGTASPEAR